MTITLAPDLNIEPGCYVDGHHGQYGVSHLIHQFCVGAEELAAANEWEESGGDDDMELIIALADEVENALNEALPEGLWAGWIDGEFFISAAEDEDE